MNKIHTSDKQKFQRLWNMLGGTYYVIRRTGEVRYIHPLFDSGIRINGRRKDVPAKLLSRLNTLIRREAANDPAYLDRA